MSEGVIYVKIKITVQGKGMIAVLEDNVTTHALVKQMPMTLPMMDLYGREMCYRYGSYALPTGNAQSEEYRKGDIVYWAPSGSLVIFYAQDGEHFPHYNLGHIDVGTEVFRTTGDTSVTFELLE